MKREARKGVVIKLTLGASLAELRVCERVSILDIFVAAVMLGSGAGLRSSSSGFEAGPVIIFLPGFAARLGFALGFSWGEVLVGMISYFRHSDIVAPPCLASIVPLSPKDAGAFG